MQSSTLIRSWRHGSIVASITCFALLSVGTLWMNADESYARSRDYDLEHSRIALRFDVAERKIIGDVTHSLSVLRSGTDRIAFDSVGLQIQSVTLNKAKAKFDTTDTKLNVALPKAAKIGDKFEIEIKYEESLPRASTSSFRTRIIPTARRKSGARANPKTRGIICPPTTIPTTA